MSGTSKIRGKAVNVAELVHSMKQELDYYWSIGEALESGVRSCMINRVQKHIRDVDRFSYEPFILSIGPYHHGATRLLSADKIKWIYLDHVLKLNCNKTLFDYLSAIQELAKEARLCYSEDIEMDNEKFLQMLVLDGCFILVGLGGTSEIFAQRAQSSNSTGSLQEVVIESEEEPSRQIPRPEQGDPTNLENIASNEEHKQDHGTEEGQDDQWNDRVGQWFARFIDHDLLLLENQIPMFVVRKLFDVLAEKQMINPPFTDGLAKYIEIALRFYPKVIRETDRPTDFHHLLHLCHIYFKPNEKFEELHFQIGPRCINRFLSFGRRYLKLGQYGEQNSSDNEVDDLQMTQQLNRWRRAAQYIEAGVKFKRRLYDKADPHSLLDIRFSHGTLEIPCIVVDEYTGSLFRNLIAFEQTCPQFGDDFTAYIVFLSQLLSMPEDITLLAQREIIVHHLDSDESVSDLFTMLSKDVVFDFNGNYYLKLLCQTMEAHYQNRINRWMAWLWLNHFSNPWLAVGAFATIIVLVCTIVQTVYGILAYVKPPK